VAEDSKDGKVKTFSLPRFRSAEMTDEIYEGRKIDPEAFFANSFGVFHTQEPTQVKLRFSTIAAAYVKERRWHSSQRVISKADGTIELLLDVGITPDLVQWVLGFGNQVEVIEPAQLKDKIVQSAESIINLYSSGSAKRNEAA
jgi:proteasome accessory factor B